MKIDLTLTGCFRSGTNYTRAVLEQNYHCTVFYNTWGWKHGLMPTYNPTSRVEYEPTNVLTIVKNPFSILHSWYKYVLENGNNLKAINNKSFKEFLRSPIYFYDEWNKGVAPQYYFSNPVQMWNSVVWNQLSFVEQMNGIYLKYESMLENPELQCQVISDRFGLTLKDDSLEVPKKRVNNMGDGKNSKGRKYVTQDDFNKTNFFLNKHFMDSYQPDDISFVQSELNLELIEKLNYQDIFDDE